MKIEEQFLRLFGADKADGEPSIEKSDVLTQ